MKKQKIKILRIALFLLAVWCCDLRLMGCSSFAQGSPKEEETLFVARKAFEDGFYEVSLGLLARFLQSYPDSPRAAQAELLIGQCFFYQGKFLDALTKFEELLNKPQAKNIKDALYYWIAEVHFKGNNFSKATVYYKLITSDFPNSSYLAQAYYSLGWCLFQEQHYQEALDYFQIVEDKFSQEPQAKEVPFKILECLYNLKDYLKLKDRAAVYLNLYSKDPLAASYFYFYLAESDYYLNNFSKGIEGYQKVLKLTQDARFINLSRIGLVWSQLKLKQYPEAENALLEIKQETLDKKSLDVLLLAKGILLAETNRVNEAKKVYEKLLGVSSDPVVLLQAYLGEAEALYNLAEYDSAVKVYQEALKKITPESTNPEAMDKLYYGLAWAFLKQGEFKEAINAFQKIAKTTDDKVVKVSALCQIGDAYQDSGDYAKAKQTYDDILKDYPDSFYVDYVQYQLGMVMLKESNYQAAIMSFLTLKKNFPESKLLDDASYALGLAYFQNQDYNSSREVFQNFQVEFPQSILCPQATYLLGTSLYNLGKFNEAQEVFKNIARLYSQDIELVQKAEYEIADCYYQMGNEQEAMNRFKALRAKYPDASLTSEVIWWLGSYYYRYNDLGLARRYYLALIQDFPKSNLVADAYYALASTYVDEEKYAEAITNFQQVIALDHSELNAQAAIAIADIYAKKGELNLALDSYRGVLVDHPNLGGIIYPKMADLFFQLADFAQALDFYRKSLEAVPIREISGVQLKIAETLETQGRLKEAVQEYLKVTYLYSEDATATVKAYLRVARIFEAQEDFQEALNIYKKVIAMNVPEAKYAQERIDWIKSNVKIGK